MTLHELTGEGGVLVAVRTIYGAHSRQGLVVLEVGPEQVQLPADKAREIGAWLIQAGEAADGDAFLVWFFTEKFGLELEQAAQVLAEFRAWRAGRGSANGG